MRFGYVLLGLATLAAVHTSSGQTTCDNGLIGIQTEDICCPLSCGTCGGSGCGARDGGASSCCIGTITRGGMLCSETMAPPCIVDDVETCSNGLTGIQNGDVCCDVACGECGGRGCAGRPGGSANCCTSRIRDADMTCSETEAAPCIIENNSMCDNGIPGVQDDNICCAASCGTCGGFGCARRPGGSSACCTSRVEESGDMCGTTMAAPCIIDAPTPAPTAPPTPEPTAPPTPEPTAPPTPEPTAPPTPEPTAPPTPEPTAPPTPMPTPTPMAMPVNMCSNGLAGFQTGTVCCEAQCGACGGAGCGGLPGGQGSCCVGPIASSGAMCSVTMAAPCVVDNGPM